MIDPIVTTSQGPTEISQSGENWTEDSAVLVLTYSKMERYIPAILKNLEIFWPGRPETFVVTDGDYEGSAVIRGNDLTFVELLAHALDELKKRKPNTKSVFLLLEDLCPLAPVEENKLKTSAEFMLRDGFGSVSHPWPANRNRRGRGRWQDLQVASEGESRWVQVPADIGSYNCLVSVLWDYQYLKGIVAAKLQNGIHDPWEFEKPLNSSQRPHLICELPWPIPRDGFYVRGELNPYTFRVEWPDSPLFRLLKKERGSALKDWLRRLRFFLKRKQRQIKAALSKHTNTNPANGAQFAGELK